MFNSDTKNLNKKLRDLEIEDLKKYCKEHGFTKEDTERFIKNSLRNLEE